LESNDSGDFYVDSTCIDCGACCWMAPDTFESFGPRSRVHRQPKSAFEESAALRALVACPTASIGALGEHDVRGAARSFPHLIADNVYHCGYHHEDSYGAASYLVVRPEGNVLIDSPRYAPPLVKRLEEMGGVSLMFLTHRDDVADHAAFAKRFGCRRVMHVDDVSRSTREVEVQLSGDAPTELAADLVVVPTPGHTRGSACLVYAHRFAFTGDHVAWSLTEQRVHAFNDACWYDWEVQTESMRRLAAFEFEHLLPGHGAPCSFTPAEMRERVLACAQWMASAR
jgi:glyoxylase-like metal-dependent hydrolase (beta-lactamase superfamily II)/ferredoxin